MFRSQRAIRRIAVLLVLLFCTLTIGAQAEYVVGPDIGIDDITDFYYTVDAPLAASSYQRYQFYVEDGNRLMFHESRQGGAWPLTEEYTVASGTVALTDGDWEAFYDCLRGGAVKRRSDEILDGDDGPWMYLYWAGDQGAIQEFTFASPEAQAEFEALCIRFADNHILTRFCFTRGGEMVPQSREVILQDGSYCIQDDEGDTRAFDPALMDALRQVIAEYDLESWDGFHDSDPNVLDGEFFSLEMSYADGSSIYASGDNAFPERYFDVADSIEAIFKEDELSHIAGVYRYEGEGFGGDFTITLNADGTYAFSEGPLSSYHGGGTWYVYYDAVCLNEENGFDTDVMFYIEDDALIYYEAASDGFPHVKVSDSERFVRQDETE